MPSPLSGRIAVGHPVDVASGVMYIAAEDFRIPGRMELVFARHYSTAALARSGGALGPGWAHDLALTLTATSDGFVFAGPGGAETLFERRPDDFLDGRPIRVPAAFSELAWEDGRFIVTVWDPEHNDAQRFVFLPTREASVWPAVSIEAAMGRAIDLSYDRLGRLALAAQRRERRAFAFSYDIHGRLERVTFKAPTGFETRLLTFQHDDAGRLVAAFDPLDNAERFQYDGEGRIVRHENRAGGVFHFAYDDSGRCIRAEGAHGYNRRSFRYFPNVGYTEVTDSRGEVWRYQSGADGQVETVQTPLGGTFTTEYDDVRRIVAQVDANGGRTEYTYDAAGNRSSVTTAVGATTRFEYNAARQLTRKIDAAGGEWALEYDASNYLVAAADPTGARWRYDANAEGEVVRTLTPLGTEMRARYGANGDLLELVDAEGNATRFAYNDFGWLVLATNPMGGTTAYDLDALCRVTAIQWPDGRIRRFSYDAWRNISEIVEPDGSRWHYRYGTCGRLLESIDPIGRSMLFRWGSEPDQLREIRNAKGEVCLFEYDADGRPVAEVDFSGRRLTTTFNPNGFYVAQTTAGEETQFERDPVGRLLRKTLPDGSSVSFEYDALGLMVVAENGACRVEFKRDPLGRVERETCGGHSITSRYDALGNRVERESELGHRATFGYDRNGRLASLGLNAERPIELQRNSLGQEVERRFPNGLVLRQEYNAGGRLRTQHLGSAGGPALVRRAYAYDAAGRVQAITDERWGPSRFRYDAAGQLTGAAVGGIGVDAFALDGAGNLERMERVTGSSTAGALLEYLPGGRLGRQDGATFEYDEAGRPVRKLVPGGAELAAWRYEWNGEGWLAAVTRPDGAVVRYEYDAFGRRIRAEGIRGQTEYVWDGDVVCHELDDGGPPTTWVFDPDDFIPLTKEVGRAAYYAVVDHLGTPRELISEGGRLAWAMQQSAWGDTAAVTAELTDCRLRFPGQSFDRETGLLYNRFRYYDPAVGRYLTPDPAGLAGSFNLYQYVPAPTAWTDPFGLQGTYLQDVNGRQYFYDQDSQGRVVRAEGPLCNPNRISDPQRDRNAQRNLSAGTGYDAGHLIGNQFGGPGGGDNLVLMCPSMNQYGSWASMERDLVGLTRNNSVRMYVYVHYEGDSDVPSRFTVYAAVTNRKGKTALRRWTHVNCGAGQ